MSRVWRRRHFATPFVVVIGCSQPAERVVAMPPPKSPDVTPMASPDAGIDAQQVVQTPDASTFKPSRCEREPTASGCNPPPPEIQKLVLDARVITVYGMRNGGIEFDVNMPREQDLSGMKRVRGEFLDSAGKRIDDTDFKVLQTTKDRAKCRLPGTATTLPSQRVRLYGELRHDP